MITKISKKMSLWISSFGLVSLLVAPMVAQAITIDNFGLGNGSNFNSVGINKQEDLKGTIAKIINIILGFLGIIAVLIILAGGFKWMTAAGSEDKVGEARKMIIEGVVGMVIIFAAWGIASFAINQLITATNGV